MDLKHHFVNQPDKHGTDYRTKGETTTLSRGDEPGITDYYKIVPKNRNEVVTFQAAHTVRGDYNQSLEKLKWTPEGTELQVKTRTGSNASGVLPSNRTNLLIPPENKTRFFNRDNREVNIPSFQERFKNIQEAIGKKWPNEPGASAKIAGPPNPDFQKTLNSVYQKNLEIRPELLSKLSNEVSDTSHMDSAYWKTVNKFPTEKGLKDLRDPIGGRLKETDPDKFQEALKKATSEKNQKAVSEFFGKKFATARDINKKTDEALKAIDVNPEADSKGDSPNKTDEKKDINPETKDSKKADDEP